MDLAWLDRAGTLHVRRRMQRWQWSAPPNWSQSSIPLFPHQPVSALTELTCRCPARRHRLDPGKVAGAAEQRLGRQSLKARCVDVTQVQT
jgi:hypothetical protein